jgi:hypothetical protein
MSEPAAERHQQGERGQSTEREVRELRKQIVWRRPTRRAFVAMIGAAAAILALRDRHRPAKDDPPRSTWTGTTRWIGHF